MTEYTKKLTFIIEYDVIVKANNSFAADRMIREDIVLSHNIEFPLVSIEEIRTGINDVKLSEQSLKIKRVSQNHIRTKNGRKSSFHKV